MNLTRQQIEILKGKCPECKGEKYITLEQEIISIFEKRAGAVDRIRIKKITKNIFNYSIDVKWN